MHVYRWDLDRTYLETEITSLRGLVRAAFETAEEKRTVPGAKALLQGLCAFDPAARVVVISGSPLQMREVLERKLTLDGVRLDRLILKDNLGNLRRGRLRALRAQIGYKLPHLLEDRLQTEPGAREWLFGDDSETDALIYTAYAELLAGNLDEDTLRRVLTLGEAYPDAVERTVAASRRIARGAAVEGIFIRVDRGVPLSAYRRLGPRVMPCFSWAQAALALAERGRLGVDQVAGVAEASGAPEAVAGWLVDAARRGMASIGFTRNLLADSRFDAIRAFADPALDRLSPPAALSDGSERPDLFGFYEATRP
jgi:hypothetical protein